MVFAAEKLKLKHLSHIWDSSLGRSLKRLTFALDMYFQNSKQLVFKLHQVIYFSLYV